MWFITALILLSILICLCTYRRNNSFTGKPASCPQIGVLTLFTYYMPIFLAKGFIPAILSAREYYGPIFCLSIPGVQRRIFFITDLNGRNAVSKNPHIRLPAAQVAKIFGLNDKITKIFVSKEYLHGFASALQGVDLKNMTNRHSIHLQKTIRECLNNDRQWINGGLYDLCSILVYESITTTLYGSSVDARSIVKDLKIFDTDVHLLAYPSIFRWFKPSLIRSKNKIAQRLSSAKDDDLENTFNKKVNELGTVLSKEDEGQTKAAILWASYGNLIPAIFWTYYYLRRHPNVIDIILQEIESASDDPGIYSMPQLDSAIEETMRLMANALVVRECVQDIQLMIVDVDYQISLAENDMLVLFPYASQIDENYFPHPSEFIYDRFLASSPNEVRPVARKLHAPFGEGKFICPGRYLGRNIMKLTIVSLLTQFDIEFLDHDKTINTLGILKTRHGFGVAPPEKDLHIRYRVK